MHSNHENSPLPYGWVTETHNGHPFYVDTKATPPRSIWVHPYEDDQYLREHPDVREKVHSTGNNSSLGVPIDSKHSRRHSYNGHGSPPQASSASSSSVKHSKRGLLGKIKDKAIGTKEARQAEKRHNDELRAQQQQQRMAYMQQNQYAPPYGQPQRMGMGGMGMGGMGMGGMGGGMGGMGGGMGGMGRRGGGMGGMALPLAGGLAGGLLLGDMMDGGFNDNNYGGGDYGGGDFGGGGFDGGGGGDF